jgi:uncharacterized damage-inducible protein DinB
MTTDRAVEDQERADFLEALATHRGFLRHTVRGLSDEQARERTTVSELCLGGLIKHVTRAERLWAEFIVRGPGALGSGDQASLEAQAAGFSVREDETLAGLLEAYEEVARSTDELVVSLLSLDASQPLPAAPWYKPGAQWSARQVLLHMIAETAQHAGHADIIRESLDGAKTMG